MKQLTSTSFNQVTIKVTDVFKHECSLISPLKKLNLKICNQSNEQMYNNITSPDDWHRHYRTSVFFSFFFGQVHVEMHMLCLILVCGICIIKCHYCSIWEMWCVGNLRSICIPGLQDKNKCYKPLNHPVIIYPIYLYFPLKYSVFVFIWPLYVRLWAL